MVRIVEVEINEVVSVVMNIISHMFESESKRIRVTMDTHPNLPKVYVNYEEIKQAFLNIVKNAFEAMPEGGQFIIRTRDKSEPPRCIEVTFVDNGMGIKKENLSRLSNPFFTTKLRGTGLGLAICHRIISERHGGKIYIESEENKGTTIKVELPIGRPLGEK
jgi:signal transduction histidine kinase